MFKSKSGLLSQDDIKKEEEENCKIDSRLECHAARLALFSPHLLRLHLVWKFVALDSQYGNLLSIFPWKQTKLIKNNLLRCL